ncbi:protein phosphatase 2C domain-containing protein [Microcoleus sp. A006_D1]|uniref:hypothetical protein n=1 Tax=Microcoleus sp. A006_D1 TaxID=3055267 RepID=UPI002FD77180
MQNHNHNEIAHFTMPKVGEQETDIQDVCCWSTDRSLAAIADGASTSLWPREWANFLVEHFCHHNQDSIASIHERWEEWLRPLQEKWRQHSLKIKKDPTIPWYAQGSKDKDHGSATFVGLKLRPPNEAGEKIWEALAVGDSCLFQIKPNSDELVAFLLNKSEQFTTVTNCFHSLPEYKSYPPAFRNDLYEEGDIFLLATDALAEWIIKDCENRTDRWKKLISVATQEEFTNFINQLRDDRLIKNDDTTLLRLKVVIPEGKKPKPSQQNPPKSTVHPRKILVITAGIIAFLALITLMIFISIKKQQKSDTNVAKKQTINNVPTPTKSTTGGNFSSASDSSSYRSSYPELPIYSVESSESDKPIGYLLKKPSELENSQSLWVHIPKAYLYKTEETDRFIMTIPADATPLALYIDKPAPKDISPQDFAGYLLPAQYSVFQPIDSRTFKDARWVKVNFRWENKGG